MDSLLYEIEILSRPNSAFRGSSKWRHLRENCESQANVLASDGVNVTIFRSDLGKLDHYSISNLVKRLELKRNPALFQTILKLWQHANPAALRTISKEIYQIIIETLYKQHSQSLGNPSLVSQFLGIDSNTDLHNHLGLTFLEFYDIIFECIDCLAKSTLINEYCRIIQNTIRLISESPVFCITNLHNKRHLKEPQRQSYQLWMQNLMRSFTPLRNSEPQLPDIYHRFMINRDQSTNLTKLQSRSVKKEYPSVEKLLSLVQTRNKSPVRSVTPKLSKVRVVKKQAILELLGSKPPTISPSKGISNN